MISQYEEKMTKSVDNLGEEFANIRAGRANPHILDKIQVDYYGQPSGLQAVANISVPEARIIQIQPWDASLIKEIEKAILASDLGLTPSNDGKIIRLVFPELTEERRKEIVKDIKKLLISNYEQEQYTKKQIEELEKENNLLKQQNQALMNAFEIKKTAQPQ